MKVKVDDQAGQGPTGYSSEHLFNFFQPYGLVLDLGCGVGRHLKYMDRQGLTVMGLDIARSRLQCMDTSVFRIEADACRLPFKTESFDSILCSEVLEHLENPAECIVEVHRILKREGIALFTVPCLNIPIGALVPTYRRLVGLDHKEIKKEHLHVFSDGGLFSMLKPLFRIINVKYVNFTTFLMYRFGIGYQLDSSLSSLTEKVPPLHYLAASVWVKATKKEVQSTATPERKKPEK